MVCGSPRASLILSGFCANGGRISDEVESSLMCILEEFWNAFWQPRATDALTTLRERRLLGGKMQTWTDEDAVFFFQ
jgi:hypothetical protein